MPNTRIQALENKRTDIFYTRDTPFAFYLEDLIRIGVCDAALEHYIDADKKEEGFTFGQIVDKYPPTESWARSMLTIYDGQFDEDLRKGFLKSINNPIACFRLWMKLINLTDEEDIILEEKFIKKLPSITEKLNYHSTQRFKVKNGNNSI